MARKVNNNEIVVEDNVDPDDTPKSDWDELEEQDEFAGIQALLDAGATNIFIYRLPRNGPRQYVEQVDAENFDLERIRQKWGAGRYVFLFKSGNGKFKPGSKTITLAEPLGDKPDLTALSGVGGESKVEMLLKLLLEQQARQVTASPIGNFQEIMAAMISSSAAQAQTMMQSMMTLFQTLQEKQQPRERESMSEMMAAMRDFMEIKSEFGGGDSDNPLAAFAPILPSLAKAIDAYVERGATAQAPGDSRALPPRGADNENGIKTEDASVAESVPPSPVLTLRLYVAQLVKLADQGANPEEWAATIGGTQPQSIEIVGNIYDVLGPEKFYADLFRVYPDAARRENFFRAFVETLLADDDDDNDDGSLVPDGN